MSVKSALYPINLASADGMPDWKVVRLEFIPAGPETVDKMLPGFLVKITQAAGVNQCAPALAADDAALGGVIIDLPTDPANTADKTVAVALMGSFNRRQIHYANAHAEGSSPTPISPVGEGRLRDIGIFLDPSVTVGPFAP